MNNEQKSRTQRPKTMDIVWDKKPESTFQKFKEKEQYCINKTKLLPMKYRTMQTKIMIRVNYLNFVILLLSFNSYSYSYSFYSYFYSYFYFYFY